MIREDYAKVGVPMLPVVAGDEHTSQQIWLYTLLVPATLLLVYPMHVSGAVYAVLALLRRTLNLESLSLLQNPSDGDWRDRFPLLDPIHDAAVLAW